MALSNSAARDVLPAELLDHHAVHAWRRIKPDSFQPQNIEVLRNRRKSAVYRLSGVGSDGSAVIAKRCPANVASIERILYETVLPRLPLPVLEYYGFVCEPEGEFAWVFMADAGPHKYSLESAEHRALAGQWLATVHGTVAAELEGKLPERGPDQYLQLLRSARAGLLQHADDPGRSADEAALLRKFATYADFIEAHWDDVENCCAKVPRTLVHGDFVIKNLRIQTCRPGPALLVFDWEMAGWGAPATDLAQFVGRCASPDMNAYCATVRPYFPALEPHDVQRLADCGNLLRGIDKIFWISLSMTDPLLQRALPTLGMYEPQLATALAALNWR